MYAIHKDIVAVLLLCKYVYVERKILHQMSHHNTVRVLRAVATQSSVTWLIIGLAPASLDSSFRRLW